MKRVRSERVGTALFVKAARTGIEAPAQVPVSDLWNRHVAVHDGPGLPRPEEAAVLAAMGYHAFQFEVPWPVIMKVDGSANEEGVAFVRRLIDELRQYGLVPIISTCRWQRPLWIRTPGGWKNVKSEAAYQTYISLLHDHFFSRAVIRYRHDEPWDAAARELKWLRNGANPEAYLLGSAGVTSRYAGAEFAYPS